MNLFSKMKEPTTAEPWKFGGVRVVESRPRPSDTPRILSSSETIAVSAQRPAWLKFTLPRMGFKILSV